MDSDRKAARKALGETKTRIRREVQAYSDAVVWVTQGYAIENYVPVADLTASVSQVHPEAELSWKGAQFVDPLSPKMIRNRESPVDKIAIANAVVSSRTGDEWPLDLRRQIQALVRMIRYAND